MFKSTNDISGSQHFTLRVRKQPSGSFKVTVPASEALGAVEAPESAVAIRTMSDRIARFVAEGYDAASDANPSLFGAPTR